LAIFNWANKPAVELPAFSFFRPGDRYRMMDPTDLFGRAVLEGTYDEGPIRVPVSGEFAAFVVLKEAPHSTKDRTLASPP
jgi:hypothetical protein